jgi:hypothetical protein
MKTKLLRKIRSRYSWEWVDIEGLMIPKPLIVLDHREKVKKCFKDAAEFISHYIHENWGVWSGLNYDEHILKRERTREYTEYLNPRAAKGIKKTKSLQKP